MNRRSAFPVLAIGAFILAAIVLRIAAGFDEFWIDEVLTFESASQMRSPFDVFALHFDNNHYLNTLYFWLLGGLKPYVLYRIPSLVAGAMLLVLLTAGAWKRGAAEGGIIAVLAGFSHLLIFFSSSGRGYMPMLLFGYLSYRVMDRYRQAPRARTAILFSVTAVIAFLWHLTYIVLYAALAAWSFRSPVQGTLSRRRVSYRVYRAVLCHAFPVLFLSAIFVADIWRFRTVGGPFVSIEESLLDTVRAVFGTPDVSWLNTVLLYAVSVAFLWAIVRLAMRRDDRFVLLVILLGVTLGGATLQAVALDGYMSVAPRHFLLPILAFFLVVSGGLAHWLRRDSRARSSIVAVVLCAYVLANAIPTVEGIRFGKQGSYVPAIRSIVARTEDDPVVIGTDGPASFTMLRFYAPLALPGRRFAFPFAEEIAADPPEWFLASSELAIGPSRAIFVPGSQPGEAGVAGTGARYRFDTGVRQEGWYWDLYRRVD